MSGETNPYLNMGWGWDSIVEDTHNKLMKIDPNYEVFQVKQKFGGLRYYFDSDSDRIEEMYEIVDLAEKLSMKTCQSCGGEGAMKNNGGWYVTLCEECYNDWKEKD